MPQLLIRSASLTNYVEVARTLGIDAYQHLASVGIDRQALLNPDHRVPVQVLRRLLESSALAAGVDDFGLRMAESRQLSNLGPLLLAIREESSLRKAIESMSRYLRLHNQALAMCIEEKDEFVLIRTIVDGAPSQQHQSVDLMMGVLYRILRLFQDASWKPNCISFVHAPPAKTATYLRVFGMPVRFGQEFDGIVCRAADLELPLPTYDPSMAEQARRFLNSLLTQSSIDFADKVRQLITALLPLEICSVDRIAEQLGIDRRTVHNRLSSQGQSYSSILNAVRKKLVTSYVENQERPLSDVATLLGFASLSAFSRWFNRQFGCSVTEWRARQVNEPRHS